MARNGGHSLLQCTTSHHDHRTSETLTEPRETITYLDHSHVAPTELHGRKLFLEDFNKTLRDEVNLEELSDQSVTVVQETMQPEFVSLWLRHTER